MTIQTLYAGGAVFASPRTPNQKYKLVFQFGAANAATTNWNIEHSNTDDATGCLPAAPWVKRKAADCSCPTPQAATADFLATFTANGAVAAAGQIAVNAGDVFEIELGFIPNAKWIRMSPIGAAAGVVVTLVGY